MKVLHFFTFLVRCAGAWGWGRKSAPRYRDIEIIVSVYTNVCVCVCVCRFYKHTLTRQRGVNVAHTHSPVDVGGVASGPQFSPGAVRTGSHHRAPVSTSHMKPCVEPDGVDLQTQGLRVRAIQPPETGLTRPRGCRLRHSPVSCSECWSWFEPPRHFPSRPLHPLRRFPSSR